MAKYDYGSPSPSPPPADIHANHLQRASLSDLLLHLRRRANSGPADGHSRHRQQQQQVPNVINMDHRIPPVRMPDGTTRRCEIMCIGHHCPEAPTVAYPATATVQIPQLHLMTALSTMFVGAVGLVDNLRCRMTKITKGSRMLYVWPR